MILRFLGGLGHGAIYLSRDIGTRSKVREENMMFVFADGSRWRYAVDRLYVGLEGKREFELEHECVKNTHIVWFAEERSWFYLFCFILFFF